ncbi:prepilin-type N-terminal cleavage/methylation domain-containing protein [Coleofasciculus sp. FACHB-1120]|nr:prepilin-type N-terminal cleavage/methylation domain-containing protein [Coleofasciculus sp. FACHB-1120]
MNSIKFMLLSQLKRSELTHKKDGGFTLIEVLVAMILAALVIAPLLGFMVNILDNDRKEQAKSASEQEIKDALDYISQDLAQAVYIYDNDGLKNNSTTNPATSGIKNQIPPFATGSAAVGCAPATTQCVPILVLWKRLARPKALPTIAGATCPPPSNGVDNCNDANVYSLVAYYLIKDLTPSNNTWSKAARIGRFEIRDGVRNPNNPSAYITNPNEQPSSGFKMFDLKAASSLNLAMNSWTNSGAYTATSPKIQVLVDYIDQSTNGLTHNCPNPSGATTNPQKVPANLTGGFYACINSDPSQLSAQVFIRGNALARISPADNPPDYSPSSSIYFPSASIQVKGRGFLYNK